jgi:hypothetical protein
MVVAGIAKAGLFVVNDPVQRIEIRKRIDGRCV